MDIGSTLFVNLLRQQQTRTAQAEASQKQDSSQIEQQYYKDMSNLQGLMEKSRKAEADWYEREIEQAKKRGEMAGRLGQAAPTYDDPEYSRAAMLGQQEGSLKKQEDDAKKAKIAAELGIKIRNADTQERHAKVSEEHLKVQKDLAPGKKKLQSSQEARNWSSVKRDRKITGLPDAMAETRRQAELVLKQIRLEEARPRSQQDKGKLAGLYKALNGFNDDLAIMTATYFSLIQPGASFQGGTTPVAGNTGATSTEVFTEEEISEINKQQ